MRGEGRGREVLAEPRVLQRGEERGPGSCRGGGRGERVGMADEEGEVSRHAKAPHSTGLMAAGLNLMCLRTHLPSSPN